MTRNLTTAVVVLLIALTAASAGAKAAELRPVDPDAYAAFCTGMQTAERGDFTVAVKWLEKTLALDPESADAHVWIGAICDERLHTPVKARQHFEQALKLSPDNFLARYGIAKQLLSSRNFDKGVEQMLLAVQSPEARANPELAAKAYTDLATASEALGKFDQAAGYYALAASATSSPVYVLVRLAHLYRRMDQNDKAIAAFLRVKKLVPGHAPILLDLCEAYEADGKWREALTELQAYMNHPDGPAEQNLLLKQAAELAEKAGLIDTARELNRKLLLVLLEKYTPETASPDLCEEIAGALEDLGELQNARPYLERAAGAATGETSLRRRSKLGMLYDLLGLYDESIKELRASADAAEPEQSIPLRVRLSAVLDKAKKTAEAENVLKDILAIPGSEAVGHAELGMFYGRGGNIDGAAKELQKAIEMSDGGHSMPFRIQLSIMYAEANRPAEAEQTLVEARKRFPDSPDLDNALGWFYAERGLKLDTALTLIETALKAQPKNPYYLDSLGWVYFKQGRKQEALEQLQKAAALTREGAIWDHLGDVYFGLGQPDKAGYHWQRSLQFDPSIKGVREKLQRLGGK